MAQGFKQDGGKYLDSARAVDYKGPLARNMPVEFSVGSGLKSHVNAGHLGGIWHHHGVFLASPASIVKSEPSTVSDVLQETTRCFTYYDSILPLPLVSMDFLAGGQTPTYQKAIAR